MVTKFSELYGNEAQAQKKTYERLKAGFAGQFGSAENIAYFSAPGRTEIGGNHTDHNHGRVLAAAVNLDIVAAARKIEGNRIYLKSVEYPGVDEIDLNDLSPRESEYGRSSAVIKGICARCKALGYEVGGFEAYTITRVLKGSGLSSSAAFEIAVVTIISHLYNQGEIDPITAAVIAQYAENQYFGKPSGLMDQMASSVGGVISIDFRDTAKPKIHALQFDLHTYRHALCIVDTGGNHANLTGEYAAIPQEMKRVAKFFGKEFLRDVDPEVFYAGLAAARGETGDRALLRAMHFFDDDRLAAEEAAALQNGDFDRFKQLIHCSGISSETRLQNVFAAVNPGEQGLSLALALSKRLLGAQGAYRVHGGGFAGTIQAFVPLDMLAEYQTQMEEVFGAGSLYVLSFRNAGGTCVQINA